MKSKNFKREIDSNFKILPELSLNVLEAEEQRLDLRHMDSNVLALVELNQKKVKDLFDKKLF